ncbi:MAG: DUF4091 domain-containing protein [Planctomycetia bacterium]|nr:DUF4091 domain-containing protein [Planctomycetia bacterium]
MKRKLLSVSRSLALTTATFVGALCPALAQEFTLWQVDVCDKVFYDATPSPDCDVVKLSAASNEYESAQVGIRSEQALAGLVASLSPLRCDANGQTIPADALRVRQVGYVPLVHNTPMADAIITRKAPCDMPDPILEEPTFDLEANTAKALWLTVRVPKGAQPGRYDGTLTVKNDQVEQTIPVQLDVFPFELPDARHLYMTNWWSPGNIADRHHVDFLSDAYWDVLEKYIANMAEHRQNVLLLPCRIYPGGFVSATIEEDGSWSFDFSNLEKLLDLAKKYGVDDRLELTHIGGINRQEHIVNFSVAQVYDKKSGESRNVGIDQWLEPYLKAVCDLLRARGVFDRAMIHVADEPYIPDIEAWREASQRVHDIEPELKRIDAIETINFTDRLEVWVPKLSHFDRWRSAFEARRAQGEFWYYICCHPFGETYPNRFMDLPAARVRTLHWLNYSEDLIGYLHWGYNYWRGDAFGAPTTDYGPGDTHVVYNGKDGPLDSIRWEVERESVEDYEYLKLLENAVAQIKESLDPEKAWFIDPKARAMELARRVVPDLKHATTDYQVINQTRQTLVNEIIAATGPVKLVVQTFPEDNSVTALGPALHELYGYATPGATVLINDEKQNVSEDGFFKKQLNFDAGTHVVDVVAQLDGNVVKTTRTFVVK